MSFTCLGRFTSKCFWDYCEWYCFLDFLPQTICHLDVRRWLTGSVNFISINLAESVFIFRIFLVEFLGSFMYTIISYTNKNTLISSFPVCIPLITLSYLITVTKISSNFNIHGEGGQSCFGPHFKGSTMNFSQFRVRLSTELAVNSVFIVMR